MPRETADAEISHLREVVASQVRILEVANRTASEIVASQTGIEALKHLAEAARALIGARYAAIGVASASENALEEFVTVGLTDEQERGIGARPKGAGVLGLLLTRTEPLRLDTLSAHPASAGFPPGHPPMESFLGVPIRHGERVLGSLYLTEKPGGFNETDEIAVAALSMHLAVAIRNLQMLKRQRTLVSGLIAAQEEERRAVAYELHDGLTQYVLAAHAQLETFQALRAEGKPERAEARLEAGMKYLKDAVVESRRLINGLRTLALDDLGLTGALEQLLREEKERNGWQEASLSHNLGESRLSLTRETAAFRIAQEALTNIRKHAKATRVWVRLERDGDHLLVEVRDDGAGFTPSATATDETHVGLHGMAERARLLDGTLQIESAPGAGTTVRARLDVGRKDTT